MSREDDLNIWLEPTWAVPREKARQLRNWYDGIPLNETMKTMDRRSGDPTEKFPLKLNLIKLTCDLHRDLTRGVPEFDDILFVRAAVAQGDDREVASAIMKLLNEGVWRPSQGGSIQQEGMLGMNVYGGTTYKLSWEPWNTRLPYRIAVRHIKNPSSVQLSFNFLDPWHPIECYFGYELEPALAKKLYGVEVSETETTTLYLEHWTRDNWSVSVNGQVPTMRSGNQKWKLEGENLWGLIPFYFIPHERAMATLLGTNHADEEEAIVREINSRVASISDVIPAMRPGVLWARNIGQASIKTITGQGMSIPVLDAGRSAGLTAGSAQEPFIDSLPFAEPPVSLIEFPQMLLDYWLMMARISPAIFGLDDTRSGRITGPAISARMHSSVSHAITERTNYTTGKTICDYDILSMMKTAGANGMYEAVGVTAPDVPEMENSMLEQVWAPILPLDKQQKHDEYIERWRERAISKREYLSGVGERNIDEVMEGIEEWEQEELDREIELIKAKPAPTMGGIGN